MLCTNRSYLMINIAVGGAVGFFNCFATQLQQMMCSRGYSNLFSGLCGSMLLGTGFIGSIFTGTIVQKTGRMEEVAKIFFGIASIAGILVTQFLRKPDQEVLIALFCAL
jgi:FLVCR family MFS transporter 7